LGDKKSTSHLIHTLERTTLVQNVFRLLLGAALLVAGIAHLSWLRTEFRAQVPRWLPLPADLVVGSGLVELGLGAALIALPRCRTTVGWVVATFFVRKRHCIDAQDNGQGLGRAGTNMVVHTTRRSAK